MYFEEISMMADETIVHHVTVSNVAAKMAYKTCFIKKTFTDLLNYFFYKLFPLFLFLRSLFNDIIYIHSTN